MRWANPIAGIIGIAAAILGAWIPEVGQWIQIIGGALVGGSATNIIRRRA